MSRGPCHVEDCDRPHHAHGYCAPHAQAFKKHGDPLIHLGRPGRKRLAEPGYDAVHKRLARERGPASAFPCVDCGKQAQEWSYRGGFLDELTCPKRGCTYSPLIEDYDPRCIRCHRLRDDSLKHSDFRNERGQFVKAAKRYAATVPGMVAEIGELT
jgi:hypothetical protein